MSKLIGHQPNPKNSQKVHKDLKITHKKGNKKAENKKSYKMKVISLIESIPKIFFGPHPSPHQSPIGPQKNPEGPQKPQNDPKK